MFLYAYFSRSFICAVVIELGLLIVLSWYIAFGMYLISTCVMKRSYMNFIVLFQILGEQNHDLVFEILKIAHDFLINYIIMSHDAA